MIWFAVVSHQNEILEIYTYNASNLIHLGFFFTNFAASDVCRQITCTITTKIILLWVFFMKHLHLKLSWLVSSMVNPPFSEQIDNICRNCFILVSKTAVDTFNETLAIFWHTSIDRLSFWWSVLIITFFGVIFETLWVIFNALKDFSSKNGWWFLK